MFGLRTERIRQRRLRHRCRLKLRPGDIVYITGASGAGKTVLLNALYEQVEPGNRLRLNDIALPDDRPAIDCIDQPIFASTETFTRAGLGDIFSMLQTPTHLSAGQQHRFRLAAALAHPATFVFADEFTSSLDRITAASIAHQLRKLTRRSKKIFVLGSCHEDVLADLLPDILIVKGLGGKTKMLYKDKERNPECQFKITKKCDRTACNC
ncbi:MAG: ATP-binding cassette domain-containing protein [Phycisphaerae bacterium]|nr:ATP-binding cassette domain-containing protein [Phycisphaerae bacterium]